MQSVGKGRSVLLFESKSPIGCASCIAIYLINTIIYTTGTAMRIAACTAAVMCVCVCLLLCVCLTQAGRTLLSLLGVIADAEDATLSGAPDFPVAVRTRLLVGEATYAIREQPSYAAAFRRDADAGDDVLVRVVLRQRGESLAATVAAAATAAAAADGKGANSPRTPSGLVGIPSKDMATSRGVSEQRLTGSRPGSSTLQVQEGGPQQPELFGDDAETHWTSAGDGFDDAGTGWVMTEHAQQDPQADVALQQQGQQQGLVSPPPRSAASISSISQAPQQHAGPGQRYRQARAGSRVAPALPLE